MKSRFLRLGGVSWVAYLDSGKVFGHQKLTGRRLLAKELTVKKEKLNYSGTQSFRYYGDEVTALPCFDFGEKWTCAISKSTSSPSMAVCERHSLMETNGPRLQFR